MSVSTVTQENARTMQMSRFTDPRHLREQYKDASNLDARITLHERFTVSERPWPLWVFDHLLDLPKDCRLLELGVGSAALWTANKDRIPSGWRMTLSDLSEGMLGQAQANLSDAPHTFEYLQIDAQDIPLEDSTFDAVIANHMLYHVPDRAKAFSEIRRVLRSGGRLFAATNGPGHMRQMSEILATAGLMENQPSKVKGLGFNLDNGLEQLAPYFADMHRELHAGWLEVTEAQPLLDYFGSASYSDSGWFTQAQLEVLRRLIEKRLAKDGAIRIDKSSGLFTARKP